MDKKLSDVYYSPRGYQKVLGAVEALYKITKVPKPKIKEWLKKQALWQIYLPPPQDVPRPASSLSLVQEPNDTHQADLLYLPHDTVRRKTYKYALTVVDEASRYKQAEPLTDKTASQVAEAFTKIYKRSPLKWPRVIKVDPGKEFMASVNVLFKNKKTQIQRGETGNHRAQGIVERFNRTLAERLFGHQYAQEMTNPHERSREWVSRLPDVLKALNGEKTRLIGHTPNDAIKLEHVALKRAHVLHRAPTKKQFSS